MYSGWDGDWAAGVYSPFLYMCFVGILLMDAEAVNPSMRDRRGFTEGIPS